MIDPSRFVYVTLNRHDKLKNVVRDELVLYGFEEKKIIFEKPSKFANIDDYFAVYVPDTKKLYVDEVGKAETKSNELGQMDLVQSKKSVFSVDLSSKI